MRKSICLLIVLFLFSCGNENSSSSPVKTNVEADTFRTKIIFKKDSALSLLKIKKINLCSCRVNGFTPDNYKKLEIYPTPADTGNEIIYADGNFIADVEAANENWFQLNSVSDFNHELKEYRHWWIRKGDLEVKAVGDNSYIYKLYRSFSDTSQVIGFTFNYWTILDCKDKWILVEGFDWKRKEIQGWIPADLLCPNPYTNCYPELPIEKYIYTKDEKLLLNSEFELNNGRFKLKNQKK